MLDQITKRKIDLARNILVGKIPNPISQVHEITNALDITLNDLIK